MPIKVGDAVFFIRGDDSGLDKILTGAQGKVKSFGKGITSLGKKLTLVGAAGLVGFAGIIKTTSDFQSAFAGVRKTLDLTEDQFGELRREILGMSKSLPVSADELAGIAEIAGQMGVKGVANVKKFTRTIADLGVSTDLTFEAGAKQLSRFINITQGATDDIDNIASAVVDLGNNFATTESEITSMALRLAGAGQVAGLTQAEILGIAAAASSLGIEAEAGGTAISRLLRMMQMAPDKFAKLIGVTVVEFKAMNKAAPAKTFEAVLQAINGINESGGDMNATLQGLGIKQVRLIDVTQRLALGVDGVTEAIDLSTKSYKDNIALTEEAEKRYKTFASQFTITKNRVRSLAITVGEPFLEPLSDFLKDTINPLLEDFEKFIDANKDAIEKWIRDGLDKLIPKLKELWEEQLFPVVETIRDWIKENPELTKQIAKFTAAIIFLGPFLIPIGIGLRVVAVGLGLVSTGAKLAAVSIMLMSKAVKGLLGLGTAAWAARTIGIGGAVGGMLGGGASLGLGGGAGAAVGGGGIGILGIASAAFTAAAAVAFLTFKLDQMAKSRGLPRIGQRSNPALAREVFGEDFDPGTLFPLSAPGFASGGFTSGPTLVGERGPEIISPPSGSRVFSNQDTRAMGGGGGGMNVTINVNGAGQDPGSLARMIADAILELGQTGELTRGALALA